jgi:choline dehydrogenase-like flavoprotein
MGGARMGHDAKNGVVDGNLRVHGISNLYVAGAAVAPCTGFPNNTFTSIALGLRLCDHLAEKRSADIPVATSASQAPELISV